MSKKVPQEAPSFSPVVAEGRRKTEGRFHFWAGGPPIFDDAQLGALKQLIDDEFEGAQLEFGGTGRNPKQLAGAPIMFPSWLLHRVTPVTSGRRYSLVAWIRGPNWR